MKRKRTRARWLAGYRYLWKDGIQILWRTDWDFQDPVRGGRVFKMNGKYVAGTFGTGAHKEERMEFNRRTPALLWLVAILKMGGTQ